MQLETKLPSKWFAVIPLAFGLVCSGCGSREDEARALLDEAPEPIYHSAKGRYASTPSFFDAERTVLLWIGRPRHEDIGFAYAEDSSAEAIKAVVKIPCVFAVVDDDGRPGGRHGTIIVQHDVPGVTEGYRVMDYKNPVGDWEPRLAGKTGDYELIDKKYISVLMQYTKENGWRAIGAKNNVAIPFAGRTTNIEPSSQIFPIKEIADVYSSSYFNFMLIHLDCGVHGGAGTTTGVSIPPEFKTICEAVGQQ